jgi:hypothetical protein
MIYSLLVTTGIAQPSQPLAGFGPQRERTSAAVRRALAMIRNALSRRTRRG